jgi:hypothetical protein
MSSETGTESFAITPANGTTFQRARALWVGTGGNVVLRHRVGGATATFTNVQDGTMLDVCAVEVLSTNTTASNIRGVL